MQFRTKARAVDLLGKGQIADLPTAITELWKNGYDAYADNLTAEIFKPGYRSLSTPLFMITDDGKGMSKRDILQKWLVLGTDSKSRATLETAEGEETLYKAPRIKAGEKGIGRLSVAYLGNPMLMVTKKMGHPIQLVFFDWRLLENFNLFLDDIQIPVQPLSNIDDMRTVFADLKEQFLENLLDKEFVNDDEEISLVWDGKQKDLRTEILKSVDAADLPIDIIQKLSENLSDLMQDHGTKFLIFEPIDQLMELATFSNEEDTKESREFTISSLSGFVNPFKADNNLVSTNIFIHEVLGYDKDIINTEGNFFTSQDYDLADVLIDGIFDGNGNFIGKLRIYDQDIQYDYQASRKKLAKKFYGPVPIKLGYSQGESKDSMLSEGSFKKINDKVTHHGGLYIYRDEFRVLPYGRPNADFLKFEERRSKRIGTYYFSYRRMFGYLELSREKNEMLQDKSSREGLIANDPYRAFEADLIAFFIQVAKDFFSDKAEQSIFLDQKKRFNEEDAAIQDDKKRETQEKKNFSSALKHYPDSFKEYEHGYAKLLETLDELLEDKQVPFSQIETKLHELQKMDIAFENLLPEMPKRYKPTDLQLDRLNRYEEQILSFERNIKKNRFILLEKVSERAELRDLKASFSKNVEIYMSELESLIYENFERLRTKLDRLTNEYDTRSKQALSEFDVAKRKSIESVFDKSDITAQSEAVRHKFEEIKTEINKTLLPMVTHIDRMSFDIDEELLQGAYKAQYDRMKTQWSQVQDTAQLGIAVEIIDHEFNVLYSRINRLLVNLANNDDFASNSDFSLLEITFRSLEDKYDLLSPLYKINGAIAKPIKCTELLKYITDFFDRKINEEHIIISSTPSFKKHIINIKEPILYTVMINIINNAIYWMQNSAAKEIRFDYFQETNEILIINSGTPIEEHRLSKIFDLFYSNRPTGRGIGLYLAKQSLNENYFDIEATNEHRYNYLNGACFIIKPYKN